MILRIVIILFTGFTFLGAYGQSFEFAVIGDLPYFKDDSLKFNRLIDDINADSGLSWVIHTGDIKSGSSPCSDEYFQGRFDWYQQFEHPFILTPGDNDWTDCHRKKCGSYAPLDRLAKLREIFYANPHQSLGQNPIPLETQSAMERFNNFPENQLWRKNGVVFGTLHIVGSQNATRDFDDRTQADDWEVSFRTQANQAWLAHLFDEAQDAVGLFITIHANPSFEAKPKSKSRKGFEAFHRTLLKEVIAFGKPVIVAHGDSHYFRYDKPLTHPKTGKRIEQFTRLENFGDRDIHWVKVIVDPTDSNVFSIKPKLIPANFEPHE